MENNGAVSINLQISQTTRLSFPHILSDGSVQEAFFPYHIFTDTMFYL